MVDPSIFYFSVGMGLSLFFIYGFMFKGPSSKEEETKNLNAYSLEDYKKLVDKTRKTSLSISKNNHVYLGILITCLTMQELGRIFDHPLFGNDLVISMTYLAAFTVFFKYLTRGSVRDKQMITNAMKGIRLEVFHPEWKGDYFEDFIKYYKGFGLLILAFFRVIIPSWLLMSAFEFGVLNRFIAVWSQEVHISLSVIIFGVTALALWKIGCHPYRVLVAKSKEVIA